MSHLTSPVVFLLKLRVKCFLIFDAPKVIRKIRFWGTF